MAVAAISSHSGTDSKGSRCIQIAIIAAAFEGVDATPIEGFNPDAVDNILGLREKGLRSAVLLPLGYRKEDTDWLVNLVKVRKPMEDLVTVIE